MCTLKCCGFFCFGLSAFCTLALVIVALVLHSGSEAIEVEDISHSQAANNCIGAAVFYIITGLLSVACIFSDRFLGSRRPVEYETLSGEPHFVQEPLLE